MNKKLLLRLTTLAIMLFGTVVLQSLGDRRDLHWPWYFLHQVILGVVPMVWLILETMPRASRQLRIGFITTSALFIGLSAVFELLAIQHRYWWFYTALDHLTGWKLGAIPIEEFMFYPLFLNLPILFYIWLDGVIPRDPKPSPTTPRMKLVLRVLGGLFLAAGAGLFWYAQTHPTPLLDLTILPSPDPAGALTYKAGPPGHGWTLVQTLALSGICFLYANLRDRVDRRRLWFTAVIYFVFAFFVELMACGRGWWVWNHQQVLGLFTWILPIESYGMYFTGAVLPIIALEGILPMFAPGLKQEPVPLAAPGG